jgi:hypothetical protein
MDGIILQSQAAFLLGHFIGDDIVALNEIIDYWRQKGRSCLILMVDLAKAYDSVDWGVS